MIIARLKTCKKRVNVPGTPCILKSGKTRCIVYINIIAVEREHAVAIAGSNARPVHASHPKIMQLVGHTLEISDLCIRTRMTEVILTVRHRYAKLSGDRS